MWAAVALVLVMAVCSPDALAAEQPQPVRDRAWPWLMGAHSAAVMGDAYTTHVGLRAGAREANPLFSWAGDEAPVLGLAAGAVITWRLHELHKSRPRMARTLIVIFTVVRLGVVAHNARVIAEQE